MPFTAEELEAMRRADEEIEAEFSGLTLEEYHAIQARDRRHHLDGLDNKGRKIAEAQRTYYQANREKIAEAKKGRILYDLRHEHGMSQRRLAKALGVSQPAISQWETGAVPFDLEAVQAYFRGLPTEHEEAAGVRATRRRPGKEKRYDATGESISQSARPFQGEGRETVEP